MKFSIGGVFEKPNLIYGLLSIYDKFPDHYCSGHKIESVYGSLPNLIWNGGRVTSSGISKNSLSKYVARANTLGAGVFFTFTNLNVRESDLANWECNAVLRTLSKSNINGVIVSSLLLANHVRETYPQLKIKLSLTYFYDHSNNMIEEVRKQINNKLFDIVVIPPEINDFASDLVRHHTADKIEVLVNETCYRDCQFKRQHYSIISNDNLFFTNKSIGFCNKVNKGRLNDFELIMEKLGLTALYEKHNIEHFKLSGRTLSDKQYLYFLVRYLIKQEYWNDTFDYFKIPVEQELYDLKKFIRRNEQALVW